MELENQKQWNELVVFYNNLPKDYFLEQNNERKITRQQMLDDRVSQMPPNDPMRKHVEITTDILKREYEDYMTQLNQIINYGDIISQ